MQGIEEKNEFNEFIKNFFPKITDDNNSLIFEGSSGRLIVNGNTYKINDILTIIDDEIFCRFKSLDDFVEFDLCDCNLNFSSNEGFEINMWGKFYKNFDVYDFKGLKLTCIKGNVVSDDIVDYYSFIENLNIDESILDFGIVELEGVKLIKNKLTLFPNVDGYFHKKDKYSHKKDIDDLWNSFYFLLKLFSAGRSFMNMECICSKNYHEFSISRSNLNFIKNHDSCFYVDEKDNLLNFIKSSFPAFIKENKNNRIAFKSFIHYMSMINGNNNDFDLLSSFVALEILAVGNGILMDDETFLQNRLDNLLNEFKINKKDLNEFFKDNLAELDYNDYLRCLIDYRSKVLHGDIVNPHKLSLLINTFLTIIFIRLLNVNCSMYFPILNKKYNTKRFIGNFCQYGESIREIDNENNIVKIFESNDELYLPLDMPIISNSINPNDRYRIITFKTLGENGKCLRNIKIDKR